MHAGCVKADQRDDQAKESADDLLKRKAELEKEMKSFEDIVPPKEHALHKKLKTIGNYVHDSVPVSDDEVCPRKKIVPILKLKSARRSTTL